MSNSRQQLNVPVCGDDSQGMIDLEMEFVRENPSWIVVLEAYQTAQAELAAQQVEAAEKSAQAAKSTSDASNGDQTAPSNQAVVENEAVAGQSNEGDDADSAGTESRTPSGKRASRWVERIVSLPGIETEELSKIHGRLIAYDLLKCDLAGRSSGMVYQLTASGKEVLRRLDNEELTEAA